MSIDLSQTDLVTRLRRLERIALPGDQPGPNTLTGGVAAAATVAIFDNAVEAESVADTIDFGDNLDVTVNGDGSVTVDGQAGGGDTSGLVAADGSVPMTGSLDFGGFDITNLGSIDGGVADIHFDANDDLFLQGNDDVYIQTSDDDGSPLNALIAKNNGEVALPTGNLTFTQSESSIICAGLDLNLQSGADATAGVEIRDNRDDSTIAKFQNDKTVNFAGTVNVGGEEVLTTSDATSGPASVSEDATQVVASATDLNFDGNGVAVADDGDGTATVTVTDTDTDTNTQTINIPQANIPDADAAVQRLHVPAGTQLHAVRMGVQDDAGAVPAGLDIRLYDDTGAAAVVTSTSKHETVDATTNASIDVIVEVRNSTGGAVNASGFMEFEWV